MATGAIEAKLAELRKQIKREWRARVKPRTRTRKRVRKFELGTAVRAIAKVVVIVALPFLVHVRLSVYLYKQSVPTWLAIVLAAMFTAGIVTVYAIWLSRKFVGAARATTVVNWIALPLVAAWTVYSTFYLARVNAKTDAVRDYYSAVHPILRVALSTVILVDGDLVITDTRRRADDYARMGLPVNERTYHYQLADGWVHAVDLRTIGRSEIKNRMVQLYFWTMGFSTLRHVGTADHLHVQLRLPT